MQVNAYYYRADLTYWDLRMLDDGRALINARFRATHMMRNGVAEPLQQPADFWSDGIWLVSSKGLNERLVKDVLVPCFGWDPNAPDAFAAISPARMPARTGPVQIKAEQSKYKDRDGNPQTKWNATGVFPDTPPNRKSKADPGKVAALQARMGAQLRAIGATIPPGPPTESKQPANLTDNPDSFTDEVRTEFSGEEVPF